jgi:hypothetical protein
MKQVQWRTSLVFFPVVFLVTALTGVTGARHE